MIRAFSRNGPYGVGGYGWVFSSFMSLPQNISTHFWVPNATKMSLYVKAISYISFTCKFIYINFGHCLGEKEEDILQYKLLESRLVKSSKLVNFLIINVFGVK